MITKNEISSLNLSPTKKDFVQIWNELIEVASKITERWDPTSTNESDPGIVLLKVLAGIADKLNYNIDKNILEAYMPTAAQMESMRKLCELVGYDIKYYQSAETKVRIRYIGNTLDEDEALPENGLAIPKFTTITNAAKDITFVTTNVIDALITNTTPWVDVDCIEGQISKCESINENNLITLAQLDDNNRYYLPEVQIAENGIFVYNALTVGDTSASTAALIDGTPWKQVSNLNTQSSETRVFKFGYDSFEGRPYLEFPNDIGSLIGDGLFIYFVRTSGLSGNISPRTLEVLEPPAGQNWENYSAEQFEVVNVDATTNGANIESISAAYSNFKRTIGTFDTLVTCRDYMNKIYSLMDMSNSPYVSNILVTDIRNDINNAITLCSCNESGILYKEVPLTRTVPGIASSITTEGPDAGLWKLVVHSNPVAVSEEPLIDHFDLRLYPFKTFTQVSAGTKNLAKPYDESFTYTEQMNREIEAAIANLKTCAHNLTTPVVGDIVAINNYLRLNALIATSTRVSEAEADAIITNVKVALVNAFNMRELDFGEEIPFDNILAVIENADSRIKAVSLQEPTVLTTYSIKDLTSAGATSKEYGIAATEADKIDGVRYKDESGADYVIKKDEAGNDITVKDIYNKLVLRNILAGRASLFNYDETFIPNNSEKPYTTTHNVIDSANAILADAKATATQKTAAQATIARVNDAVTEALTYYTDTTTGKVIPGEYILPVVGLYNGVVTLKIIDDENYTPYETYTPEVAKNEIIDNISRVEAVCEIQSNVDTFKNIELKKNEVIKFRAPNLITTTTFPAYVYYRFERAADNIDYNDDIEDGEADGNVNGRYAKAVSLGSFIQNTAEVGKFFDALWTLAGSNLRTFTAINPDGKPVINAQGEPANTFNTSIAIKTDTELNPDSNHSYEASTGTIYIYTDEGSLSRDLEVYFGNDANKDKTVTFSSYPLNSGTMSTWGACVKSFASTLPGETILWRLSSVSSYPKGKLVIEDGRRLFAQSGEYLINSRVGDVTYICTDIGANPDHYAMSENSDIELNPGDKLYIHYTPSSTNEDGETVNAEPISRVYESTRENPVIIRPSGFTLKVSEAVHQQGTSWKKTDVDFGIHGKKNLLALAPNEQIELRSVSKVVLNTPALFYKNFDNAQLEQGNINEVINYELKDGEYIFYTDQNTQEAAYYGSGSVITLDQGAFIPKAKDNVEVSQILEQGLHIIPWSDYVFLSNDRKITISEYQYVTLVEGDTLNTLTVDSTDEANLKFWQEAAIDGYAISNTNWVKCLSTEDAPIIYTPANSETSKILPRIELSSGPSTAWEVCSFLELSTSPGYSQPLRMSQSTATSTDPATYNVDEADMLTIKDKLVVYSNNSNGTETSFAIEPAGPEEPISFKLSTIAQSASGSFKKTDSNLEDGIDDSKMQLKVFKEEAPAIIELNSIDEVITPISTKPFKPVDASTTILNNYWTKLEIGNTLLRANRNYSEENPTLPNALKLNFMIPDSDMFGIFSIYLETPENKLSEHDMIVAESRVFIDVPKEFGSSKDVLSIFNYTATVDGNEYTWWPEGVGSTGRLYLRAGLNCIKVAKSCSIFIKAEKLAVGSIIYDNMRLVRGKETNGINLELLDPGASFNAENGREEKSTEEKKALADNILTEIAKLDKHNDFYYNTPVENSLAIEFDNNISSFSDPHTLYDINNVNNDFVISKLDIKYLKDGNGLKIAKSSKY